MNQINKKILFFLNSIFKNSIFRIALICVPPIILAMPFPLYLDIAQIMAQDGVNDSKTIEIPTEVYSLGRPLFSRALGIEAYHLPVFICLKNANKLILDGKLVFPSDLSGNEDAGAMSFPLDYSENSSDNIYAKIGEDNCKELQSKYKSVQISFDAEIKNPSPVKSVSVKSASDQLDIIIELYSNAKLDYEKTKLYGTAISRHIYLNILIFLIGWSFLILHIENLYKFLKGKILDKILLLLIFALEILFTLLILYYLYFSVRWSLNLGIEYLNKIIS